jgi:hypothetical protein
MLAGLWLLCFLVVFAAAFTTSVIFLIIYGRTKNKSYLKKAALPWIVVFVMVGFISYSWWSASLPRVIDKNYIVGTYEIDANFYPGKNATWQKEHFRFQITRDDKFIFYDRLADKSEREYHGSVTWAHENPEKWSIQMEEPHHVIDPHPVLYRDQKQIYYVFRSKLFGNMFFRKVEPHD